MKAINTFIDKIKYFESRNSQNFNMTMREAKDLHTDITKLLLVLEELHTTPNTQTTDEVVNIEIKGENW